MAINFKSHEITSRALAIFFVVGILLTLLASLLISKRLSHDVSEKVKSRELEFVFGAIEAGPLAIARLQSAAIAQQELVRLLSNPNLRHRGWVSASIQGGPDLSYEFAKWSEPNLAPKCPVPNSRKYTFADAMNPFEVTLVRDECFQVEEERSIFQLSSFSGFLLAAVACGLLALSVWPAASSMRRAETFLSGRGAADLDSISYSPVKELIRKALRSIEFERDAALSRLAAQVSHDIRSPLSALNLVVAGLSDLPADKEAILRNSAKRINEIANQLLESAKNGEGKSAAVSEIDVGSILSSIADEKRTQPRLQKEIQLKTDLSRGPKVLAQISAVELSRVISNLIQNSIEAIPADGQITLGLRFNAGNVEISVIDNGKGIPPEVLSQLGQRGFSHGKAGTQSGSGLGLSHAREVCEEAGGRLVVQSKVGSGTIVLVQFPYTH